MCLACQESQPSIIRGSFKPYDLNAVHWVKDLCICCGVNSALDLPVLLLEFLPFPLNFLHENNFMWHFSTNYHLRFHYTHKGTTNLQNNSLGVQRIPQIRHPHIWLRQSISTSRIKILPTINTTEIRILVSQTPDRILKRTDRDPSTCIIGRSRS